MWLPKTHFTTFLHHFVGAYPSRPILLSHDRLTYRYTRSITMKYWWRTRLSSSDVHSTASGVLCHLTTSLLPFAVISRRYLAFQTVPDEYTCVARLCSVYIWTHWNLSAVRTTTQSITCVVCHFARTCQMYLLTLRWTAVLRTRC